MSDEGSRGEGGLEGSNSVCWVCGNDLGDDEHIQYCINSPDSVHNETKSHSWRKARKKPVQIEYRNPSEEVEKIYTQEGVVKAVHGEDYVIRGVEGEIYPISKEIFEKTYWTESDRP